MIGYNIFPIGFSSYEKSTIETFFRLAGRRSPHWTLTPLLSEARVVLFNATSQQDVESIRTLVASWQKVIVVGSSDYGTGWSVLPRPIKLTVILNLLDEIVQQSLSSTSSQPMVPEPAVVKVVPAVAVTSKPVNATVLMPDIVLSSEGVESVTHMPINRESNVASLVASTAAAEFIKPSMTDIFANITTPVQVNEMQQVVPSVVVKVDVSKPALIPLNVAPSFIFQKKIPDSTAVSSFAVDGASRSGIGRALLVDDSDIALKHMQNRLRHFGYECDLVRSGEEALAMVSVKNYHFVFLDVMMVGLDGYQTCKAIKNNKARLGPAPVVVMLTSKGGTIDKIRGSMAGCDAYLTKPLNDKRMGSVLAKFDESTVTQRWEVVNQNKSLIESAAS